MRRTFFIRCAAFCLALGWPALLAAQGAWYNVGTPEGGNIISLVRSTRGNLYAGTLDGTVFTSADDGTTWRKPNWSIAGNGIASIHAAPGGALFVFAGERALFRSTDEGVTWRPLASNLMLHPVLASDSSGALLGVEVYGLVRSTDNGESWTHVDDEHTDVITGIAAGPGGIDYVLRTAIYDNGRGFLKRSLDGGRTWAYMDTAASPFRYTSLAVSPRGTVFLGTINDGLIRSTDRGETWSYVAGDDSTDSFITRITVLPDGEVVAMTGTTLLRSTDDGVTWRRAPVALGPDAVAVPVTAAPAGARDLLVGTADAGVLRIDEPASPWELESISTTNRGLRGLGVELVTVAPNGTIFAVSYGRLHRSTDGGTTWTDLFRDVAAWSYPPVITSEGAVLVSLKVGSLEGILRSTDNGTTWDTVASSLIVHRVASAPDGRLYASTFNAGLHRSTDDGRTWSRFGSETDTLIASAFHFEAGGDLLVGTTKGLIYRISHETGAWTSLYETWAGQARELVAAHGALYIVSSARGIRRSTDGGRTWEIYNNSTMPSLPVTLQTQPDGTLWTLMKGGVFRSTDGGANWMKFNDGLGSTETYTITIGPDGRPWVGARDGLYTLAAPSLVPRDMSGRTASISIESVHPVPGAGRTTLELRTDRAADLRCTLFDARGSRVRILFERRVDAGSHAIELDLSELPEGSYVLRLEGGGGVVARVIPIIAPAK